MKVDKVILGIHPLEDSSNPLTTARVNGILAEDQQKLPILPEEINSSVIISVSDIDRLERADVSDEIRTALSNALEENRIYYRNDANHTAWLDGLISFLETHGFNLTSDQAANFSDTGYRELFIALRLAGIRVRHSIIAIAEADVQKQDEVCL